MPIYEYRCRGCTKDFEKYVHGSSTKVACPSCDSGDVMRKLSVFGLRSDGAVASPMMTGGGGGGCCGGGGCGCH
jgi:putative FmdB family regulatory protein